VLDTSRDQRLLLGSPLEVPPKHELHQDLWRSLRHPMVRHEERHAMKYNRGADNT
jgi:hypothetical protein